MNKSRNQMILFGTILLQLIFIVVITFSDFGFFFPGEMGDIGTWFAFIVGYLVLLFAGIIGALGLGENLAVIIQVILFLLTLLIAWSISSTTDSRPREPDYARELAQHSTVDSAWTVQFLTPAPNLPIASLEKVNTDRRL